MGITLRTITGSTLSYEQVDTNFSSLIYSASLSGSDLKFHYTSSKYSPQDLTITLPIKGMDLINITVWSENGNVFTNGDINTTLVTTVYKGAEDITDLIPSNRFNWIRQSANPAGDSVWNSLHTAKGKSINITDEDFSRSANFSVEIDIPEELLF